MTFTLKNVTAAMAYADGWLNYWRQHRQLGALGVLVRWQGETVLRHVSGSAKPDHLFAIASNSKMFTATAIMQLCEAGLLKLDDPVVQHLPWLKEHSDRRWRKVTIEHLLTHGAGITRDGTRADYWNGGVRPPDKQQLVEDILRERLYYPPGKTFKYSNYGYGLLGLVVEAASGTEYKNYIKANIIRPLGLKHSRFDDELDLPTVKGEGGFRLGQRGKVPVLSMRALAPAAGLWSTLDDLARFGEELAWGGAADFKNKSEADAQPLYADGTESAPEIRAWF